MIGAKTVTGIGLSLDLLGVVVLLWYSWKTTGATTRVDQEYICSPWWQRAGYFLIALGFLGQLWGCLFG
jgi:hypothetical protein